MSSTNCTCVGQPYQHPVTGSIWLYIQVKDPWCPFHTTQQNATPKESSE